MPVVLSIYIAGVAVGLLFTDGSLWARIALALAWPIGPLAFVVVVTGLLVAALYLFPVFGAVVAAAGVAAWWVLS